MTHDESLALASTMLEDAVTSSSTSSARRVCGQIAILLGDAQRVEECRSITESRMQPDGDQYLALLNMTTTVQHLLAHPELIEGTHDSIADAHRTEALKKTGGDAARRRVETAPDLFVVTHDPSRIAALVGLMDEMPPRGGAHVRVENGQQRGEWIVHVVTHDREALLARITDALRSEHLNIVAADLATWPDGAVLDSFTVQSQAKPREDTLQTLVSRHVSRPSFAWLRRTGGTGLQVSFENNLHPENTVVTVTGPDREGLLWRVATTFNRAKVSVHHARIETVDGRVNDRFEVTDQRGRKLDVAMQTRIVRLLR